MEQAMPRAPSHARRRPQWAMGLRGLRVRPAARSYQQIRRQHPMGLALRGAGVCKIRSFVRLRFSLKVPVPPRAPYLRGPPFIYFFSTSQQQTCYNRVTP